MRTTNGLDRLNKAIKRRTRVAKLLPNSASCLRFVSAILAEQDVPEYEPLNVIYFAMRPQSIAAIYRKELYHQHMRLTILVIAYALSSAESSANAWFESGAVQAFNEGFA